MANSKKPQRTPLEQAFIQGLKYVAFLVAFLVLAYAIFRTEINLEEPRDPARQAVTTRVIRALAGPDVLEFNTDQRSMRISIRMPCSDEISGSEWTIEEPEGTRTATLRPNCATTTQDILQLTGTGFRPETDVTLRWFPLGLEQTTRTLRTVRTDSEGSFVVDFTMPDIRPSEEPQTIELREQWRTGISGFTETVNITLDKIIETIFLALMATVVGTILAVPISFFAARNLMVRITSPLAAIALAVIVLAASYVIGITVTSLLLDLVAQLESNGYVMLTLSGAVALALSFALFRLGPPIFSDQPQDAGMRLVSLLRILGSVVLFFIALASLASIGIEASAWQGGPMNLFGVIGNLVSLLSESVLVLSPIIVALLLALVGASMGGTYGQEAVLRLKAQPARILTGILSGIGTAIFVYGFGSLLDWLYQFDNPEYWTLYPALIIGGTVGIASLFIDPKKQFPVGFVIYTIIRTLLNVTRAIEPLIYVIVFAVLVGIGPFAGVLALTIHTIAALAKLFSEQVEGIAQGPIEAVTATGASSLQVVVFAVVPQVVPPFIAFTLYRWDINVRFSTVIGFGGGGGIGFVLIQQINLLRYSQAAVMMIAIALVVMTLDYVSSKIRERII